MSARPLEHRHFLSLEGGEGAGKTSALGAIRETLQAAGHEVLLTREPGGTPLAERMRDIVLQPGDEALAPEAELLLMFAARAQHVQRVIAPALARGAWVVSDRFTDSSYAYQVHGRGLDRALVEDLEQRVVHVAPALTLLLDLDVRVGRARTAGRDLWPDRIEREQDDFFERVREGYRRRAQAFPQRFRVIDAAQSPQDVAAAVRQAVQTWLDTQA
ncbi:MULTISPECIES: dTMP kinase [Pseudoxanthomonas]|uniref:Thymidylate kinase n=1 Tax=Pseudoxanthomonas winnipegensis TaxID=2480810 RepID=A0A4Q8LEG2_9GAMM|nr:MULTISPECIES: dTMP kinase [Pseudoxanthomonas]MDQ1119700.1 dTMP kinase [Pseudoxanthomonas winnipegensis]MDQ1132898.1 dTMP kinase [Pseudoxanthomonas winnipegensis]MDR6137098.1 dTMP kinase [Pseudoxanthomonas sp. SORGH_AS_0997]RZZ88887.1 dTMP kinase [Pseudoxanthomonas winnipegensis]TAA10919.1 dTMP kinase [Pseudoxanthomonas winnipegensis]